MQIDDDITEDEKIDTFDITNWRMIEAEDFARELGLASALFDNLTIKVDLINKNEDPMRVRSVIYCDRNNKTMPHLMVIYSPARGAVCFIAVGAPQYARSVSGIKNY